MFNLNLSKMNPFSKQESGSQKTENVKNTAEQFPSAMESNDADLEQLSHNAEQTNDLLEKIKNYIDQFDITENARPVFELVKKYSIPLMIVGTSLVMSTEASAQYNMLGQKVGVGGNPNPVENTNAKREKTDWEKQNNRNMGYGMAGMAGSTMTMSQNENVRAVGIIISTAAGKAQQIDWGISQRQRNRNNR
jgi:hypothetical protein